MTIKKISKGGLVKLDIAKCFTKSQGGNLQLPLYDYSSDEAGIVKTRRPTTVIERRQWHEIIGLASTARTGEDFFSNVNDVYESETHPLTQRYVTLYRDNVYQVLRARCRVKMGGVTHMGMTKILCTETGEEAYIKHNLLEVVF